MNRIVKKSSICRGCSHPRYSHFIYTPLHDGANDYNDYMLPIENILCNMNYINNSGISLACSCKEWTPLDNLEYLELKYKKNEETHENS